MKRINVECWIGHAQHRNVKIKALQHTVATAKKLIKSFHNFFGKNVSKKMKKKGKSLNIKACAI